MALNQEQQLELARILSADVFTKAAEEVLAGMEESITGIAAPEAAVAMALEKGARTFLRRLLAVTNPILSKSSAPPLRSNLTHKPTSTP